MSNIIINISTILHLTRDRETGTVDNNVETYCNIFVERAKAASAERKKILRQQNQNQGTPASTASALPDPRSMRISFLSLSESVSVSIDLLKRFLEINDQFEDFLTEQNEDAGENYPQETLVKNEIREESTTPITSSRSTHDDDIEMYELKILELRVFVSWVCEITASSLRRHLGLRTSDFHVNSDKDLLEKEILLLLVDGKLIGRREDALDALTEFRSDIQRKLGAEEDEKEREKESIKNKNNKKESPHLSRDRDEDLRLLSLAQELAREKCWRRGMISSASCSAGSSAVTTTTLSSPSPSATTSQSYVFASPTSSELPQKDNSYRWAFDDAAPMKETEKSSSQQENNNETINKPKKDEDDEEVSSWSEGLGYLSPFITATWIAIEKLENQQSDEKVIMRQRCQSFDNFSSSFRMLQEKIPCLLFFEGELSRRLQLVRSASVSSFTQYWIEGLRRHFFHSIIAFGASAAVARVSTPVIRLSQQLEKSLDPATFQFQQQQCEVGKIKFKKEKEQQQRQQQQQQSNFKDFLLLNGNLLVSLIVLKSLLNVLLGVISTTLEKVAASHRDTEKKLLTFAWTKVPLSTMHSLSNSRTNEITCFPNDLEGMSVGFQRDIIGFGRAVFRFGAALGAVAISSTSTTQENNNNNNSSNLDNTLRSSRRLVVIPLKIFNRDSTTKSVSDGTPRAFFSRPFFASANWIVDNCINTPYCYVAGFVSSARNLSSSATSVVKMLTSAVAIFKNDNRWGEIWKIVSTRASMLTQALSDSPRIRLFIFVVGVTGATTVGSYLFKRLKQSKVVRNFLRQNPDSETVATGGELYTTLRMKGKVLLAPSEIVELMSPLLRLQSHADTKLMKMWYDATESSTRAIASSNSTTIENSSATSTSNNNSNNNSFFLSSLRNSFQRTKNMFSTSSLFSSCFYISQTSLNSFFKTVSDLSEWVVPLIAAACYQRLLSKGLVSRFLILECLNSTTDLITSGNALWDSWDTVKLQSYKALIVSHMIQSNNFCNPTTSSKEGELISPSLSSSSAIKGMETNAPDAQTTAISTFILDAQENDNNHKGELSVVVVTPDLSSKKIPFSFAYPSRPNRIVLTLNPKEFEIPLNYKSIVAITGLSGSGKSTLLKLLLREYESVNATPNNTNDMDEESKILLSKMRKSTTLGLRLQLSSSATSSSSSSSFTSALSNFSPEFLRSSLFSFVPQQCQLLPGSFNIAENISLQPCSAKDNSPENQKLVARVRNAARLANAMDVIAKLPEGLFALVSPASTAANGSGGDDSGRNGDGRGGGGGGGSSGGKNGGGGGAGSGGTSAENVIQLSGGQIQRIGIARALFQGNRTLLMDEPTASLDPITKAELLETLRKLVGDGKANNNHRQEGDDDEGMMMKSSNSATSSFHQEDSFESIGDENHTNFSFPCPRCVVYVTHDVDAVKAANFVMDVTAQQI